LIFDRRLASCIFTLVTFMAKSKPTTDKTPEAEDGQPPNKKQRAERTKSQHQPAPIFRARAELEEAAVMDVALAASPDSQVAAVVALVQPAILKNGTAIDPRTGVSYVDVTGIPLPVLGALVSDGAPLVHSAFSLRVLQSAVKQTQKANLKKPTATMVSAAVRRGGIAAVDIAASPAPSSGVAAFSAFDLHYDAASTVVVASLPFSGTMPTAAQLKVGDVKTATALAMAQAGEAAPIIMQVRRFDKKKSGAAEQSGGDSDSDSDPEPDMARVAAARAAMLKSAAAKQDRGKVGASDRPADVKQDRGKVGSSDRPADVKQDRGKVGSSDRPVDVTVQALTLAPVGAPAPASAPVHEPRVPVCSSVAAPTGPAAGITPNNTSVVPATAAGSKNPMAGVARPNLATPFVAVTRKIKKIDDTARVQRRKEIAENRRAFEAHSNAQTMARTVVKMLRKFSEKLENHAGPLRTHADMYVALAHESQKKASQLQTFLEQEDISSDLKGERRFS